MIMPKKASINAPEVLLNPIFEKYKLKDVGKTSEGKAFNRLSVKGKKQEPYRSLTG